MSSIILQPQLSPKHKIQFPQMPFCVSHLHHSFLQLYLQPSWAFSASYIQGIHNYLLLLLLIQLFPLSIISNLIFQLQLGLFFLCFFSKFSSWICGFRVEVEKGFSGFSLIFSLRVLSE